MRQRVRLAQALAHDPGFVLLDEPMTGLDPIARAELAAQIRALPARGVGVMVSSHVLHELEAVVDRVVLVHQGRLLADGRVGELRKALPARPYRLRIACDPVRELAAELVRWPDVLGVTVADGAAEVAVDGTAGFHTRLTSFAAQWRGTVTGIVPLDDDLASVFGYLVG
jgi:ABC-2 type transport system ATP-binding protein